VIALDQSESSSSPRSQQTKSLVGLVSTNYATRGRSPGESNYQNKTHFLVERHAYSGAQIEKNEMDEACSTYGGEERFIEALCEKP
jgi:hypothetical protein